MANVRETVEREIKLTAGKDFAFPELGGEPIEPRLFVSTYHDTADHRLARHGLTLRHRVEHGKGLWQLKVPHGAARLELEVEGGPAAPPEELARLLRPQLRGRELVPVARLQTRREGVRAQGAEITHDSVEVLDGGRVERAFDELEVELLEGDEEALRRIERALRQAGARDGETRPKVLQALDLEFVPEPTEPPRDASPGEMLAFAIRSQYERILAHDAGTRVGADPEDLHQLRVATRRLRAFLRAARPLLDERWADDLRGELGWLGGALGPVRDLDVLLAHLRGEVQALHEGTDVAAAVGLLAVLETERADGRARLLEALDSERYLALLDALETGERPPVHQEEATQVDIWRSEHARLKKGVERVTADPADAELHLLRIRAKRARYAAELAGLDRYVAAAKRLQDVLGEHQDAVVAEERLRAFATAADVAGALASGRLVERERSRRARARADWPAAWRRLELRAQKTP